MLPIDAPTLYTEGMKNEMIQQECKACEQVITLPTPNSNIEYCLACTAEINEWHDSHRITPEEIEAWADLWASQDSVNKQIVYCIH